MKHPLRWHEECLKNAKAALKSRCKSYDRYVKREQAEIERLAEGVVAYEAQIEAARTQGKDGFDRDRFKIKRRRFDATVQTKGGKKHYGVTGILAPDIESARRMLERTYKVIRISEVRE